MAGLISSLGRKQLILLLSAERETVENSRSVSQRTVFAGAILKRLDIKHKKEPTVYQDERKCCRLVRLRITIGAIH